MGLFNSRQPKKPKGSIEETIEAILLPLKNNNIKSLSPEEVDAIFFMLWERRKQAALLVNATRGNYVARNDFEFYEQAVLPKYRDDYAYDLSLFVFLVIYLESIEKRAVLRTGGFGLKQELFKLIHKECMKTAPKLIKLNIEQFDDVAYENHAILEQAFTMIDKSIEENIK